MPTPFQSAAPVERDRQSSRSLGRQSAAVTFPPYVKQARWSLRLLLLGGGILIELALMLVALVPQTIWASHGFPDGPIPRVLSPVVAAAFYVLPVLTGMLCRRWTAAVVLATFPAWLDLGLFAVAAASRVGPFYLATDPHAVSTVGTLELFAVLGALGWLARTAGLAAIRHEEPQGRGDV